MVAENAIWERSFTDWSMLSHAAKSLPIDVAGFDVLKQFMAHKIETKAVFDTVEQMLRKACEPPHDQSLHNVRVEHGVELRLSTKQMVKAKNRKSSLHEIDRSEEHTSELQSLMRTSYAVFCLKTNNCASRSPTTTPISKTGRTHHS